MWAKHKNRNQSGFTIVELLIVIVVIAILAAITIVAYNGIQNSAKNAKTSQALASWVKALNQYKVDNSKWPAGFSCLGTGYQYGPDGSGTSGGQCRQTNSTSFIATSAPFDTLMNGYFNGNPPTPAMVTARSTDLLWYRGLVYVYGGGGGGTDVYAQATYAGDIQCPQVSGLAGTQRAVYGANTFCHYALGQTTDT